MLVFLVPLKGKDASSDWSRVTRLCERTLRSACAQTNHNFKVILSCSEVPEINFSHENLTVITDSYPEVAKGDRQAQSLDKIYKLVRATSEASQYAPCHVMVLDADDLVSNRLAQFVEDHPDDNGWRIDDGWAYQDGSRWIWKHPNFSSVCGSGFIIRCEKDDLPKNVKEGELLLTAHIPHGEMTAELDRLNRSVKKLPFRGGVYCASNGENWTEGYYFKRRSWRLYLRRLIQMRPVTRRLRSAFGLTKLDAE